MGASMEPSNDAERPSLGRRLALAGLLVVAVFGAFGATMGHRFVLVDDDVNIYKNRAIRPLTSESLGKLWREEYNYMYIPVYYTTLGVIMSFAEVGEGETVEKAAGGVDPRPFHTANVAAHALCALFVFGILYVVTRRDVASALGAAVFALHPIQAEVVSWASAMKDLSSGVPGFAALFGYVWYARATGKSRWAVWGLATVLYTVACLAKPSAVVLPLFAFAFDVGLIRRNWKAAASAVLPWLVIAVVIAKLATIQPVDRVSMDIALWQRPAVAGDAAAFYLGQIVWPDRFAPFYGRTPVAALAAGRAWLWTLVPVALALGSLAVRKRTALPLVALAIFLIGFAPVSGLVPFTFQTFSTVADRYVYLSMLAPALVVAWGVAARPGLVTYGASVAVLAFLGVRAANQAGKWYDTEKLLLHTLEVNPESGFAHTNLGEYFALKGQIEKGLEHFRIAVELQPDIARSRNNFGTYLAQTGEYEQAVVQLQEAVRIDPEYGRAQANLANALSALNRVPEALEHVRLALALEPDFPPLHFQHGLLLEAMRNPGDALKAYREALRLEPRYIDAEVRIGAIQLQQGATEAAITTFRAVLSKAPEHGAAHAQLGRALLIADRPAEALPHLEEGLRLRPDLTFLQDFIRQAKQASGQ
jgi:Tfp pilus assembly protein PilF